MKKIMVPLLLASALVYGCGEEKKQKAVFEDADIIAVKTARINSLKLTGTISATGLVSTANEAKYGFKIGGVISQVLVEEGQFFKKGQLLATLNATEIEAGLSQSSLNVEKAKRDYDRALNLYRDSVYTLEQLQNSRTALNVAEKSKIGVAFNERYSRIYAASDGFVKQKMAGAGEVISPRGPVLLINETSRKQSYLLKIGLSDREWAVVEMGQKAIVFLDGYPGKQFEARVLRKSQTADGSIGSFQAELEIELEGTRPAVGMFGKAKIYTGTHEQVMAVPYGALVEADGSSGFVFVLKGMSKVSKTPVEIISFDNQFIYLRNGVSPTQQVVISNSAYLNEQSTIKVIR